MMIVLPEIVLLETLNSALKFVRTDYAAASDKTKSYLYLLMSGTYLEKYKLFEQAVGIIMAPKSDPRYFTIDLMFNMTKNTIPSAYINLPSEATAGGMNAIGSGEDGYDQLTIEGDSTSHTLGSSRAVLERTKQAAYNLVIVSDNPNEVVLLYHFLNSLLVACVPHLHFKGLLNISLGGNDINPYPDLANQLYMRQVSISLQYTTRTPSIFTHEMVNDIDVYGSGITQTVTG
jgi:hypothetical protein